MALRRDAVNLGSYLVVVALALASSLFFGGRLMHFTPVRALAHSGGGTVHSQASIVPPARLTATANAGALIPVETVAPLAVLAPGQSQPLPPAPAPAPALPEVVNHGDRSQPLVALTFDSNMTPAMLQELDKGTVKRFVNDEVIAELRKDRVPATFFLSGLWIERYRDVAVDLGHDPLFEVASHSYSHLGFRPACYGLGTLDLSQAAADLRRNQSLLATIAERPTRFFRFPGGCMDARALTAVQPAGLQVVQYDVVSGDAFNNDAARVVASTVGAVGNGSIVVMHVTGGNTAPVTDRALPAIVQQLRARGFRLVRLSDLLRGGNAG